MMMNCYSDSLVCYYVDELLCYYVDELLCYYVDELLCSGSGGLVEEILKGERCFVFMDIFSSQVYVLMI
jgi:hypothetical protein